MTSAPSASGVVMKGSTDDVARRLRLVSLEASPTDEDFVEKIRNADAINSLRWHPDGKVFLLSESRNVSLSLHHIQGSYWEARLIDSYPSDLSATLSIRRPST